MYKQASLDAEACLKDMQERLKKLKGQNKPKGLPDMPGNTDVTDPLYPTSHNQPKEQYWAGTRTFAGSGGGPEL